MASTQLSCYELETAPGQATRDTLILEHLPLVRWIANRIHDRLPPEFSLDDLVSTGILGLIAAIESFDPNQNVKLGTYASFRIRGAIMDSIRGMDGIAPHHRKTLKQIQAALNILEQRLQRQPDEEEVATELGMSTDEYQAALLQTRGVTIGSLDNAPADAENVTFMSLLADREENGPAWSLERAELRRVVAEGISRLPVMERQVLGLYYQEGLSLREVGEVMKLHYSRISQLKTQAILRLRVLIEKKWPTTRGDIAL